MSAAHTSSLPEPTEIIRALVDVVEEIPATARLEAPFDELGIDSLALVEAAVVATRLYGVRVEDWELRDAGSLWAAAQVIRHKMATSRLAEA